MSYKALVSINLPSTSDRQRESFYEYLKLKKWYKLSILTNAWKVSIKFPLIDREAAIIIIEKEILEAKTQAIVQPSITQSNLIKQK